MWQARRSPSPRTDTSEASLTDHAISHMPLGKLTRLITRLVEHDGFLWGCVNFAARARALARSRFAAHCLGAPGLHLGAPAIIRGVRFIRFGRDVHVGGGIWIEAVKQYGTQSFAPKISIGDRSSFSDRVHITCIERIDIGRDVLMGSHVYISDHGHGIYKGLDQSPASMPPVRRLLGGGGPVTIGNNVWIGDNVIIVGPVSIGDGAVIGANSVIRRDVPSNCMAAGIPAKTIKIFDAASSTWKTS